VSEYIPIPDMVLLSRHFITTPQPLVSLAAMANKEVIISGGAYLSPKLLLLSGIGDCSALAELDIACTIHLPGM